VVPVAFAGAGVDDAADVDEAENPTVITASPSLPLRRPLTTIGDLGFEGRRGRVDVRVALLPTRTKQTKENEHTENTGGHEMARDAPVDHVNVVE
jgi:hypothetical protein